MDNRLSPMNFKYIAASVLACLAMTACDDTTDTIGSSIGKQTDAVVVGTGVFNVASQTIIPDSVLSRSTTGYLGKVRDPETGAYVTGNFMTQFNNLEGNDYLFPKEDSMIVVNAAGDSIQGVQADSCEIILFFTKQYGDSTQTMKLTTHEMSKAMNEDRVYYSNFDPIEEGYVRTDGLKQSKVYSLVDYMVSESTRDTSTYTPHITIRLNQPYTDKNGTTYNNYGTYILRTYYDHPEYFKNAYTFRNNVVPGFFFKHEAGLGNMAYISNTRMNIYFKYRSGGKIYSTGVVPFWGTEEVLQTTQITNDKQSLAQLAADNSCTYLKSPSGLFTELTLPVDEIMAGHEKDSIASAEVELQRLNNTSSSNYAFDVPQTLLMIPRDSLYSFFENEDLYNNKTSFTATWGASSSGYDNGYTFHNISGLISAMYHSNRKSANWNKVVVVPIQIVTTTTSSYYSSSSTVVKVTNDMSLSSTRLVKGTSSDSPIKINVIYSKFK